MRERLLIERHRKRSERIVNALAKPFKVVPPNVLTLLSVPFAITFTYFVWKGSVLEAIPFLLVTALLDAIDGAVSRMTGKSSKAGAFLDSATDRLVDVILFYSLPALGVPWTVTYLWITGSIIVPSLRAAAEAEGLKLAGKGLMERGDRLLALLILILIYLGESKFVSVEGFRYVPAVAAGVTALIWLTVFQRLYYSKSLKSFWVGFNLSVVVLVLFFYGWWDPLGTLGVSGGVALFYLILKFISLGGRFPVSRLDAALDSLALLSFIAVKGVPSWVLWAVRCCLYFRALSRQQT